ncbi:hypothetical protein [Arthrobacter oryzae]|uniref:Uncharacterized protein n=1 Tax=Arthrobacter oryzae TaxID=409290 RepID=A0A3N0BW33_9MICC|nr:hypothetical protein [Arthrobacter oryzae]RNL53917.1 hypothetical protein D7003_11610 [Arthrobacter oryzae]
MPSSDHSGGTAIEEELRLAGVVLKPLHTPRQATPLLHILIRAGKATDLEVAGTIASLFRSSCQDFAVDVVQADHSRRTKLEEWLATDTRFTFVQAGYKRPGNGAYTLVLNAGTALGVHSLEAMIDSLVETQATVLRALVDGQSGGIELWRTADLNAHAEAGTDPEKAARRAGGERWIAGNAVGLHEFRRPKPKVHLRKGAAGAHDLTIVVRDLRDRSTRTDYEQQIRAMESRLHKSESERRRLEQGLKPNRGLARAQAIIRRGPAYILVRLKARAGRIQGS